MSTEMITPDFGPSSSAVLSWTGSSDTFQLDASEQQPLWRPSVTMDDEGKRHQSIQVSLPCINVSLFSRALMCVIRHTRQEPPPCFKLQGIRESLYRQLVRRELKDAREPQNIVSEIPPSFLPRRSTNSSNNNLETRVGIMQISIARKHSDEKELSNPSCDASNIASPVSLADSPLSLMFHPAVEVSPSEQQLSSLLPSDNQKHVESRVSSDMKSRSANESIIPTTVVDNETFPPNPLRERHVLQLPERVLFGPTKSLSDKERLTLNWLQALSFVPMQFNIEMDTERWTTLLLRFMAGRQLDSVEQLKGRVQRHLRWKVHQYPAASSEFHKYVQRGLMYSYGISRWGHPVLILRVNEMLELSMSSVKLFSAYFFEIVKSTLLKMDLVEQWVLLIDMDRTSSTTANLLDFFSFLDDHFPSYTAALLFVNCRQTEFQSVSSDSAMPELFQSKCHLVSVDDNSVFHFISPAQLQVRYGGRAEDANSFEKLYCPAGESDWLIQEIGETIRRHDQVPPVRPFVTYSLDIRNKPSSDEPHVMSTRQENIYIGERRRCEVHILHGTCNPPVQRSTPIKSLGERRQDPSTHDNLSPVPYNHHTAPFSPKAFSVTHSQHTQPHSQDCTSVYLCHGISEMSHVDGKFSALQRIPSIKRSILCDRLNATRTHSSPHTFTYGQSAPAIYLSDPPFPISTAPVGPIVTPRCLALGKQNFSDVLQDVRSTSRIEGNDGVSYETSRTNIHESRDAVCIDEGNVSSEEKFDLNRPHKNGAHSLDRVHAQSKHYSSNHKYMDLDECIATYQPLVRHICRGSARKGTFCRLLFGDVSRLELWELHALEDADRFASDQGVAFDGTVFDNKGERLRFLQAHHWNPKEFLEAALKHLEWRYERLPINPFSFSALGQSGFCYIYGRDCRYRPILVVQAKQLKFGTYQQAFENILYWMEYALHHLMLPGKVEQLTVLVNLEDVSVLSLPTLTVRYFIDGLYSNYPNRLHKLFFINSPTRFNIYYKMLVEGLIPLSTRSRIFVYSSSSSTEIFKNISKSQVEKFMGGCGNNTSSLSMDYSLPTMPLLRLSHAKRFHQTQKSS